MNNPYANSRSVYFCENCESVHIQRSSRSVKCTLCNGDLTEMDGIQSVVNAILRDDTIGIKCSYEVFKDMVDRPFFGWTASEHKSLEK